MKYVDEFRDGDRARGLADAIRAQARPQRHYRLMEFCGGHTHAVFRYGIPDLLPDNIELVHGPGCPVCVTPLALIDKALAIASRPDVIFCSFGDMMRVPGSGTDLLQVKAQGRDIRIVYSPLDALKIALDFLGGNLGVADRHDHRAARPPQHGARNPAACAVAVRTEAAWRDPRGSSHGQSKQ